MKPLIFIPCLNDAQTLPDLITELKGCIPGATIFICDDGSKSPVTNWVTPSESVVIYTLPYNVGLGLTTSIAIDYFLGRDFDIFVRCDADGQHPSEAVRQLIDKVALGGIDVAWGERANHYQSGPPRNLLSGFSKLLVGSFGRLVFRTAIRDWHTGLMAFNRQAASFAGQQHLERFCEVQLLCIFLSRRLAVTSVLIDQQVRRSGESSINLLSGLLMVFRSLLTISLYAIRMQPK